MIKKIYPSSLYNFLWFIQANPVNKKILDCGAGGNDPNLAFYFENGFDTYGIDISDEQIKKADRFCEESGMNLRITKGDMRNIPFESKFFGYVYSYLSMVHLSKNATFIAINEMHRILMSGGLCYLNFLSKDDINFDVDENVAPVSDDSEVIVDVQEGDEDLFDALDGIEGEPEV